MATELDRPTEDQPCSACSAPIAAGWAVCVYCGVVLRRERLDLGECSACQSIVMTWQQYCMRCGSPASLRDAPAASRSRVAPTPVAPAATGVPPARRAADEESLELLSSMQKFLVSRAGASAVLIMLILAVVPWFIQGWIIQGNQVIARLIVPASGRVVEKPLGEVVQVEAIVLNADPGSVLTVFVDGQSLGGYEIGSAVQDRQELTWEVQGSIGSLHELTLELKSPDGDVARGEPSTVVVVDAP